MSSIINGYGGTGQLGTGLGKPLMLLGLAFSDPAPLALASSCQRQSVERITPSCCAARTGLWQPPAC